MRQRRQVVLAVLVLAIGLFISYTEASAHTPDFSVEEALAASPQTGTAAEPRTVTAACSGGPTLKGGRVLDECITRSFTVGGVTKNIIVWYTKNATADPYTEDSVNYNLQHWLNTDAEAQQVAAWFENAWQRFFTDSGHHLYDTGCSNTVNVQMEDGIGYTGIAYWASSGTCWIGIDSPMVRGGGGESTVYHEAQHYLQYSYDSGCYGFLKPNYPSDSEFIEGYADLGAESVTATADAVGYAGQGYNANTSMYDKSYGNIFNKYYIEQLGSYATPADPWHNIDALYDHYTECDAQNTLYVLSTLVPSLSGGKWSLNEFFLNFFAANWAHTWADPATQPELVYLDDDAAPFGNLASLDQNVDISTGSQNWADVTPDDYAANYYQVRPQTGCPYVQVEVDGSAGANLGINLMAAKTSAPSSVLRSAKIGEDFVRTFAGAGAYDRVTAIVNSFASNYNYDVTFTCVTPTLNILEPRQVNFVLVGDPSSPIAFLARWTVKDGASSVRGLPESSFSFEAEGDAVTLVPGTFQEVGDEYWAILLPPTKAAGTTFIDFTTCLDGSICDTETNALLYVDPGNSDIALSFDASGSMKEEDTIGEGTRLENSKRAGQVVADLLRDGDRILVQDWSANDIPAGCGLPPAGSGDGNCPLDIRTLLPRTDVTAGNVSTLIGQARTQINNISDREWTPLGGGLQKAKNDLLALPSSSNPKHVFLLSDGRENVNPTYSAIRTEIIDSGVVVNTIGLGPEAPGSLLAQIATDTGGTYRPVATTSSGSGALSVASLDGLAAVDAPAALLEALAAPVPFGHLGLLNVFAYLDTEAQDAQRIAQTSSNTVANNEYRTLTVHIDPSVNELRFVAAGKQPDQVCTSESPIDIREVDVLMPGANERQWIPISPPTPKIPAPADWIIRNNVYDDVLIVPNPKVGQWQIRTKYYEVSCLLAAADTPASADSTLTPAEASAGAPYDIFMSASVQSTVQLQGRLLGLSAGQGKAGDIVTIAGALVDKTGTVSPTLMVAVVEGPSGIHGIIMGDDGVSNDGSAGDNIFARPFVQTQYGGGYNVRILATFPDPADPTKTAVREWNGGFWIDGPRVTDQECGGENDQDKDCMPDGWERECKLDLKRDDRKDDPDRDGLTNEEELKHGTLPCRADTDNGGENDGSEVENKRDPLNPSDDKVLPFGRINIRPFNKAFLVGWTRPFSYTDMLIYISLDPNEPGAPTPVGTGEKDDGSAGDWFFDGLENDKTYYIRLQGKNGGASGDWSEGQMVTPKSDPDAPSGAILVNNDAPSTPSRHVTLGISSSDIPLKGAAQSANAHQTDLYSQLLNTVSGDVEMRIANEITMAGALWEPLAPDKPWHLECENETWCKVYAQFRDGALNESMVVFDSILLEETAGISLTKTVGIDGVGPVCATTSSIDVPTHSVVAYCYRVENTGTVTLTKHTLDDDALGKLLDESAVTLGPGATHSVVFTDTISADVTNEATWTATGPSGSQTLSAADSAQATVSVSSSSADQDQDTIPDNVEGAGDADGDGTPNFLDTDSDGDGVPDEEEVGPDPNNPQDANNNGIFGFLDDSETPGQEIYLPEIEK